MSTGAGQGKHGRRPTSGKHGRESGGDGVRDSPLAKRSPKTSAPSRQTSGLPVSLEESPGQHQQQVAPTSSQLEQRRSLSEKENISSGKSPGDQSKKLVVEEQMSQSQQKPVNMEQRELEPLTPLVIQENQDISMEKHQPQATSTPGFRSPPLSKYLMCYCYLILYIFLDTL